MAKRFEFPSWEEIQSRQGTSMAWLNTLINEKNNNSLEEFNSDFELDDDVKPFSMEPTSSSKPERPRTLRAGYNHKTKTLNVVFRDGTWWEYREVPEEMWEEFKTAPSKGKYLRDSGLDRWPDMGESIVYNMPKNIRKKLANTPDLGQIFRDKRKK